MAVGTASTEFSPVPGVRLAVASCGIKAGDKLDLVLFEFAAGSQTAGVFTQSHFAAAPVLVSRDHLSRSGSRYFLINSGNANAATGEAGRSDALACCRALSQATGSLPEEVLPFSTGVIGEKLQVENITDALPELVSSLSEDNWLLAAQGIMTTDTRPKIASRQVAIEGRQVTITGIAKGAGMIQPKMATLLAYVATDALLSRAALEELLNVSVNQSFNRITIDGDTSTNDSCTLTATGVSGVDCNQGLARELLDEALTDLMRELAQGMVRDGEGATRFVAVTVKGGRTASDCLEVAFAIANSPLMKTALHAGDANWGRIIMAVGKAEVDLDVEKVDVFLGDVCLMRAGQRDADYTEEAGAAVMAGETIDITVDLHLGDVAETVWTSDLSPEYIAINADYRT